MKNICIVGCGNIARTHVKNLNEKANLYFHSRTTSSAEKFNTEFTGKGVFEHFDEVLEAPGIEAVVLCSPPAQHKEQIVSALRAGKAILVEKPMCVTNSEMVEIEEALSNTANSLLMVAENYYYKPTLKLIQNIIAEGLLGEVQSISIKKLFQQNTEGWKSNLGALIEGGIHFISLISGIAGQSPAEVTAEFPRLSHSGVERSSITRLRYPGNLKAELHYSWETPSLTKGLFQHSYIIGDEGKIIFESNGIYVLLKSRKKSRIYVKDLSNITGCKTMMDDFMSCLNDRSKSPYSDFAKAKMDLGIIFQAYESKSENT